MRKTRRRQGSGTLAVHAGDVLDATGAIVTPVYQSATFAYPRRPTPDGGWAPGTWFYTRYGNPTTAALQEKVAALEGAEASLAFASGMGAIAAVTFSNVRSGERIVTQEGIYGGTSALFSQQAPALGVNVASTGSLVADDLAELVDADTRLVFNEIPSNPFNRLVDLPRLRDLLQRRWGRSRPKIVTDSTFATPLNLRPLESGADYAVHSATKYLNGHGDVVGGVASGSKRDVERLVPWMKNIGACMDPHQAFLVARGLKTLEVRLRRQEQNAKRVAEILERHRKVDAVWHLSLPTHPDYKLGRRLLRGPGAIVTLRLKASRLRSAIRFQQGLSLFAAAPSLGGVESLASLPVETSHASATAAQRKAQGITPNLVRLAVGIETGDDLVEDIEAALKQV